MKYEIKVGPVTICSISIKIDEALLDDSEKLSEQEIDLIIKDSLMSNLRESKGVEEKNLLDIIQESFDMFAAMELNKKHKGEFKEPSKEELLEIYKDFLTNYLKLKPIL